MSWNHRLLAHKDGDDVFFQIHEVHYDKNGIPNGYTSNGVSVGSDSIAGVKGVLEKMIKCIDKPILSVENFPNEYKNE